MLRMEVLRSIPLSFVVVVSVKEVAVGSLVVTEAWYDMSTSRVCVFTLERGVDVGL